MINLIKKATAWLLYAVYLTLAVGMPGTSTASTFTYLKPGPTGAALGDWSTHSVDPLNWLPYKLKDGVSDTDPLYVVKAPKDNFRLLGEGVFKQGATTFDWKMIEGERWITMGREDVGQAGLTSAAMSDRLSRFPKNMQFIFAAYSPENASLHVEVQKIEKLPNGKIQIRNADFTPWHGEHWKRAQKYLSDAERLWDPFRPGVNPFDNFKGAGVTDPTFHNVSWAAAKVIIGHAQRYFDAPISFVAVTDSRLDQKVSSKGGLFKSSVTVTVSGYVKPKWYVGTPIELQPTGEMGMICVGAGATGTTCDDAKHIAHAGVTFMPWEGGNMPNTEDMVYKWTQKKSGFSILFFTVIIGLLTWGIASVGLAAAGMSTTGIVSLGGAGAGTLGLAAGATYAIASTAFHSGGALTDLQDGFFGSTGSGVLKPPSLDAGASEHTKNLAKAIQDNHVNPVYGHGLSGTTFLYKGDCAEGYSVQQCMDDGLDPGTMWRPDSYAEFNTVLDMRARFEKCKLLGYSGVELNKCAAPKAGEWGDMGVMPGS